jgi:hypothetical protein
MAQTRVHLPKTVTEPITLFLNGVELKEGDDYTVLGRELVINRELVKEGELGFWRWFLGAWGVGTYRKNDVIDIRYHRDERPMVAHDVPFEVSAGQSAD